MMKCGIIFSAIIGLVFLSTISRAQSKIHLTDSAHLVIIKLKDGIVLQGRVTEIREKGLTFHSSAGENKVNFTDIKEFREIASSEIRNGRYWFSSPDRTRILVAPTAFMLNKGEVYLQDVCIFLLGANIGITDNISAGGFASIVPGTPIQDQLLVFAPKIGGEIAPDFHMAGGAIFAMYAGYSFSAGYGMMTYGNPDLNVTAGLGGGYAKEKFSTQPLIVIGGNARLSPHFGLASENYFIPEADAAFLSFGARFLSENITFDFGLFDLAGKRNFLEYPLPYITAITRLK